MVSDDHMSGSPANDSAAEDDANGDASDPVLEDILAAGECEVDHEALECKIMLPTMNGTKNCFVGTQVCVGGEWSNCMPDEDAMEMLE